MVDKSLTSTNFTQIPHTFRSYTQSHTQICPQKKQPAKRQAAEQSILLTNDYLRYFSPLRITTPLKLTSLISRPNTS